MALRKAIFKMIDTKRPIQRMSRRVLSTESAPKEKQDRQTHFGFQTVDEEEKWKKVHEVFETVANKYDLMNDVMSAGVHRVWKDIFMARLAPTPGTKLLDMAGGTGDIAFRYIKYLQNQRGSADERSSVTVCDINQAMLDVGQLRAQRLGYTSPSTGVDLDFSCQNAEQLSLPDESYTAYTIAFGIRNCTHIDKYTPDAVEVAYKGRFISDGTCVAYYTPEQTNVLEEAYRVLAPGGRFMCLEFSQLNNDTLQWIYDQYSFQVIPVLGQLFAGQWKPYQYLVESIRQFPNQEKFKSMIEDAGFRQVTYENLTFGTCAIHSAFKI